MLWILLAIPAILAQNQQWQTVEPYALDQVMFLGPPSTVKQTTAFAKAKRMTGVQALCDTTAAAINEAKYPSFSKTNSLKDCYNYFKHRLSLQKYVDYLFSKLSTGYLTPFKAAELKSQFWIIDKRSQNQLEVTYCKFLKDAANRLAGTNRAKFFERNVNISRDYKTQNENDYYNVFFFKWTGLSAYPIADAADSCLYSFGEKWGFGEYASQYVN